MHFRQSCWIVCVLLKFLDWNIIYAEKACPTVTLPNGSIRMRSGGRIINFRCKRNFDIVGVKLAVCLPSGQWSKQMPFCVAPTCQRPYKHPANMIVEELHNGGVLKYTCTGGLTRSGPETLLCDGKKWSDEPPKCIESISLGCDFENDNLCGWSQDNTDDFDWTRISGETPTANTGPMFDHTTNSSKGHYLFMESSAPHKTGQKTRIISPPYNPDTMGDMCVEFYYHMFGPDGAGEVGDLDVYVRPEKATQLSAAMNIFHQSGNQGDKWIRADAEIKPQTMPFNLVFQATKLKSWTGDIVIDDVKLHKCYEKTTTAPTEKIISENPKDITKTSFYESSARKLTTTAITRREIKQETTSRVFATSLRTTRRDAVLTSISETYQTTANNQAASSLKTLSSSTTSFKTTSRNNRDDKEINDRQRTSSTNTLSTSVSSPVHSLRTTSSSGTKREPCGVQCNGSITNGNDDNSNDDGNNSDFSRFTVSDYIDYANSESSNFRNETSNKNDSRGPFIDYDYNKFDDKDDTISSAEDDETIDGLVADTDAIKDSATSDGLPAFIPLIAGIVASVVVGIIVVAVLAWIWVRSQRQKQEKSYEDQMNIITEYVETTLSN